MEVIGIIAFGTAFVITIIGVVLVKRLALFLGFLDKPGERKMHTNPIPLGGGVAIFLGVFLTLFLAVISAVFLYHYSPNSLPFVKYEDLQGVINTLTRLTVIFVGGLGIFFLGLFDDIKRLSPAIKLSFQILIALWLVINNINLSLWAESYLAWGEYLAYLATIIWVVVITNSFNLLDHMDGLSAGVTAVVSAIFLTAALQTGQYFIAYFLLIILGATLGFLVFNIHPASIFMGDTGSLLLGYLMAVLTIIFTFYKEAYPLYSLFVPLLVLAVPLFDTISVVIIRIKNHQPIFKGDMNHLAHRLIGLGMGQRSAVFTIYLLTLGTGLPAVLLYLVNKNSAVLAAIIIFIQVILILIIITLLENAGRKNPAKAGPTI